MIRYTTPTERYSLKGIDLTNADVYVTYEQGCKTETFRPDSVVYDAETETSLIEVGFTQLESAGFSVGNANVQVNFVMDGKRDATTIETVYVGRQLLEKELP